MLEHGFIYEWVNINSGKKYIGAHIGEYNDGYIGSGKYFRRAYDKEPSAFKRNILMSILSRDINNDIRISEETLLSSLNAAKSNDYYNITNYYYGGDNFTGLNESDKAKFRKKCSQNWKPPKDRDTWYEKVNMTKYKECYQFDKNGVFIKKFNSLEEVCNYFNKKTKGNLTSALKGRRNYWQGYRWSYTDKPNDIIINTVGRKPNTPDTKPRKRRSTITVTTYNVHLVESNKIIKTYDTPGDCAKELNISKQMLIAHLNGRTKHVKNMTFIKGDKIKQTRDNLI
jgi:hypothetical protein